MTKKIVIIIAPQNFRDEEYLIPKQIFEQNNISVTTASRNTKTALGVLGAKVNVDIDILEINLKNYDALMFVGGAGSLIYVNDKSIHEIINSAKEQNKLIASICISPLILAESGILKGKKATVWDENKKQSPILETKGAVFTNQDVEQDGKIITANGPKVVKEFALKIVENI